MGEDGYGRLIYLGLLLASIAGWVLVEYRKNMGQALRLTLAWGMIFLGVMAGYGVWTDMRHDIMPRQMVSEAGEVVIPVSQDGHYYIKLNINDRDVLIDAVKKQKIINSVIEGRVKEAEE